MYHTGGFDGYMDQVRITRLAVSAIVELAAEGLRLGSRDHKCVMMATRVGRGASESCEGNRCRPKTIRVL